MMISCVTKQEIIQIFWTYFDWWLHYHALSRLHHQANWSDDVLLTNGLAMTSRESLGPFPCLIRKQYYCARNDLRWNIFWTHRELTSRKSITNQWQLASRKSFVRNRVRKLLINQYHSIMMADIDRCLLSIVIGMIVDLLYGFT